MNKPIFPGIEFPVSEPLETSSPSERFKVPSDGKPCKLPQLGMLGTQVVVPLLLSILFSHITTLQRNGPGYLANRN